MWVWSVTLLYETPQFKTTVMKVQYNPAFDLVYEFRHRGRRQVVVSSRDTL